MLPSFSLNSTERMLLRGGQSICEFCLLTGEIANHNRPFPSSKKSHLQGEAKCEAIDMKMIFNYDANKTHFHNKGFALSLVLKVRVFGTRKWPIKCWKYINIIYIYKCIRFGTLKVQHLKQIKSLHSQNSNVDHSNLIPRSTQIRYIELNWFKCWSFHVLNWRD